MENGERGNSRNSRSHEAWCDGRHQRSRLPIRWCAELHAGLEIRAELEEEAVVVVAVGALAMAGAQVQVEAGIELVAEACGVGVGVVGQVCIDVGGEECVVVGGEAVGEFSVKACGEGRGAECQFVGIGEGEGVQVEIGEGGVGLSEGGLEGQGEALPLFGRPKEDGAANTPFAAVTAKEEDPCVCGGQKAALVGKPVEVAAEFSGAGIGVAQQQGQVSGGVELSGIEGKGVGELGGDMALLAVVVQEGGGAAPQLDGESRGVGLPDPIIGATCNAEERAGRGMGGVFCGVNI